MQSEGAGLCFVTVIEGLFVWCQDEVELVCKGVCLRGLLNSNSNHAVQGNSSDTFWSPWNRCVSICRLQGDLLLFVPKLEPKASPSSSCSHPSAVNRRGRSFESRSRAFQRLAVGYFGAIPKGRRRVTRTTLWKSANRDGSYHGIYRIQNGSSVQGRNRCTSM